VKKGNSENAGNGEIFEKCSILPAQLNFKYLTGVQGYGMRKF
jgi:hypothetical protein